MDVFGQYPAPESFTPRELEILRLAALGLSNRGIADELVVAHETVRWYTKQIYSKLGAHGRVPALVRARELGLLEHAPSASTGDAALRSAAPPKHNLPAPATNFVGRRREIAEVNHLLRTSRLLTLTGPGGTGKTRLALRVASENVYDFADGVYFVDLAPLSDDTLVTRAVAAVLGVIGNSRESLLDTLKRVLTAQEMLLLIDNFEHVIEAASLVSALLAAAPRLKVLVTSREALRLSGEQEYPVPPLSLPSGDRLSIQHLTESEAVSLFVQRVQMMQPRFEVRSDNAPAIAQICTRLDGLPLAIELAAARIKLLPPQMLLARLDSRLSALTVGSRDLPARQRTLRNTIDWSYNLLNDGEKRLFARLAVFRGGRSLEAIESVCGEDLPIDPFDGIASLLDKNLLQQKEVLGGEPRFVMLETIHEYAWERLGDSGETETMRRRHAEYFVELAERAEPELRLAQQNRWFQLLDVECDNLRAVLEWSLGSGDVTLGVRLAGALYLFWYTYGYHLEGRHWTQQLLKRLGDTPVIYHAKLLFCAGHFGMLHDLGAAKPFFTQALAISRELGDKLHTAWALVFLGYVMLENMEEAISNAEEGLSLFRELNYQPGIALALNVIGEIARFGGDDERARRAYEDCLAVSRQTGETRRLYWMVVNLAFLAQHEGDYKHARDLFHQGIQLARETNFKLDMASSLAFIAGTISATGQPERAVRLHGASEAALERMGAFHQPADKLEVDRNIATVRTQLDKMTFAAAWADGRAMTLEQAVAYALDETSS
jgi:predicted ATPase/DNA-binding CsgD family transcriptional regulator